ncbi:VWA domain-containing protein [Echinimonas agarilytica]|uniref:VWA domain-containing protein n=2 Tax=Echinimonas agarilytica TaxID=1215918 RepID=A0AA41W5M6_9GAMM|nr:VWA domain-containing protein [Echinimonas agarilytica]MCM2679221.1 VWA domain-containing protein [Echinimonas agarilytica]
MTFAWPWLFILLPLPWVVRRFLPAQPAQLAKLYLPTATQLAGQMRDVTPQRSQLALIWVIWILLIAAMARPQWEGEPIGRPLEGRDLMVAVDLSQSMSIKDMNLNGQTVDRLTIVKQVLSDFIERRQGDRIGLVLFADTAYLQAPLTFDRKTVSTFLDEAVLGLVGRMTAIGDAIGVSVKHMLNQKSDHKVLVLLTDGDNTSGKFSPERATQIAKEYDVTIYTVGVGAEVMVKRSLLGSQTINPSSDLNERGLTAIAEATGGRYFRAKDAQSLAEVYSAIDALEPVASDSTFFRPMHDIFFYPLAAALGLSVLLFIVRLLQNGEFRKTKTGGSNA